MANRLQLDFGIVESQERKKFVDEYITQPQFLKKPPTEDELETMANYILWGKDEDGLNCTQRKEIQIETRNKTWQRNDTESLDAIMESPTFNENQFKRPNEPQTKISRENFDRKKTLSECPEHLKPIFEDLFTRIDTLELAIHLYEFSHGRRKEPPRESLLKKFTEQEIEATKLKIEKWNQYKYLKNRHYIVELRREQFTLRDTYSAPIMLKTTPEPAAEFEALDIDAEINVFPLGLISNTQTSHLLFKNPNELNPTTYTEEEQLKMLKFLWEKREEKPNNFFFDFRELEHIYQLFGQLGELESSIDTFPINSNLARLVETLRYYISLTDLSEAQKEILELKINKTRNQEIADHVNKKYDKSYTANYISTIFRQKIIPKINAAAEFHTKIIENICYEENFKKCNGCGKILLMDPENFVRKSRSKDGYSTKCKICDREDRQRKKETKK